MSLRHAIVGLNGFGQRHVEAIIATPRAVLAAVVDTDHATAIGMSHELGVPGFDSLDELIAAGIADSVSIVTPHRTHAPLATSALQAGLHVYVEKPLAITVSEADRLVTEAGERGLVLTVGHHYRTYPINQALKRIIDEELGTLLRILWTWNSYRPDEYYARDRWRATWEEAGGGLLANQASHDLDLLCWLAGPPTRVSAVVANQGLGRPLEDIASATIEFASGALATFQATLNQPQAGNVRQFAGDRGVALVDDAQSLAANRDDVIRLGRYALPLETANGALPDHRIPLGVRWTKVRTPWHRRRPRRWQHPGRAWARLGIYPEPAGLRTLMGSHVAAALDGGESLVSGASAVAAVELLDAIIVSSLWGTAVDLPLDRAAVDEVFAALRRGDVVPWRHPAAPG